MIKLLLSAIAFLLISQSGYAAIFHITTTTSDTYSPDLLTVKKGDTVTIDASTFHPLVQVDNASWEASQADPMPGGWGTKTAPYTFVIPGQDTIYFVCASHVSLGMRGRIVVQSASGVDGITSVPDFSLSPNPVRDIAVITLVAGSLSGLSISIYDDCGNVAKLIKPENLKGIGGNQFQMDVTGLSNGIYILVVSDKDKRLAKKFIIVK